MAAFIAFAPLVVFLTFVVTDAADFFLQSPHMGLHWFVTPKYWLTLAPRWALVTFAASIVYGATTRFESDPDTRKILAAGTALLMVLAGSQAMRLLSPGSRQPANESSRFSG
jgi:hypothetical protein